ncbi:MAG: glycosyl transferase family 36 [Candidatus Marinimicrobia bacterium]|nr:glycosyl transferase family 36 [Candidatus Neomarinimicrobiota bacterium]
MELLNVKQDYKKYGYFSDDEKEFVITRPDTPKPWVNYISNGKYSGLISHVGGGYSFIGNPKDNRITRWRYNSLPMDRPGRYVMIRDQESGEFWSPTWQPTPQKKYDAYECRHGLYYTRITTEYKNLNSSILYFVPREANLEIWKLTLKNNSNKTKTYQLFAYQELALGHALVDLINQPNDQHFNDVHYVPEGDYLWASKRYWVKYNAATVKQANESWDKTVFFASSEKIQSFDGSKDVFIGKWRSEADPIAVESGKCQNSEITAGDAMAAIQNEVALQPGEEKEILFLLGVVDKTEASVAIKPLIETYRNPKTVHAAMDELKNFWSQYLNHVQVETPDYDFNRMMNIWNQYQTSVTFLFSRDASYYHGGMLFGRGYRDSCQDIMGPVMAQQTDWVKNRILEMSKFQFRNGSTFHCYYPGTGGGEKTGHSDTQLWLPLAIMVYLKETGDFKFLEEKTPFHDGEEGTILEHLYAAMDFAMDNLTENGLAKFGPGDWNDTLDYLGRKGKGESIWVTMFIAYNLREISKLADYLGNKEACREYDEQYQSIKKTLNEKCWDGKWYIRGTNDLGQVIGSDKNNEGKLFLNTQSWAVISGVAEGDRAKICMQSVKEHLETPKGPKILHPAYTVIDDNIGLATRCVPGKKENGAVFNHPVSWAILAETINGNANRAFEIYKKALPMNPELDIERYEVEPYVYAEYVTSPDHPTYGQASHSWLTGSSTWMLRDGIDGILGIKPFYNGLEISPCIPAEWKAYKIKRTFRGKIYHFEVKNPEALSGGVQKMVINGSVIEGNFINLEDAKIQQLTEPSTHVKVEVLLG